MLALADTRLDGIRAWRKKNYTNMVDTMFEIIEKMVEFRVDSLSPGLRNDRLVAFQSQIQELQHELLKIKFSCGWITMTTFTDGQRESFAFIIPDNPELASFIQLVNSVKSQHSHLSLLKRVKGVNHEYCASVCSFFSSHVIKCIICRAGL
jgi:hypothetical protein